jgi:hypothetical protein
VNMLANSVVVDICLLAPFCTMYMVSAPVLLVTAGSSESFSFAIGVLFCFIYT